jgi:hypothetical protein
MRLQNLFHLYRDIQNLSDYSLLCKIVQKEYKVGYQNLYTNKYFQLTNYSSASSIPKILTEFSFSSSHILYTTQRKSYT